MSNIIGYLRPDVNSQNVKLQTDRLNAAGATEIYREQLGGKTRNRLVLDKLMADVQNGDTVVVTSLDRIAHSTKHLLEIVRTLKAAGAFLRVIDNGIDTSSPQGDVLCMLLAAIVDFEQQMVRESQAVGIARAKREGRYKGRKPTARAKADEVWALNAQGQTRQYIADQLGIGVASVYRILKDTTMPIKKAPKKAMVKAKSLERKPINEPPGEQLSFF